MAETEMNILDLPDEELANLDPGTFAQAAEATADATEAELPEEQDPAPEGEAPEVPNEDEAASTDAAQTEPNGIPAAPSAVPESAEPEADPETEAPAADVDYKAVYEKITAPFKANGRDIQVKDVDDAIALMQMGANYNKKMAALKPNLKLLKLLENNGLLSEEKISYLIDLEKKNPEAIGKLVKDSGIDPLELDTEKAGDYKPTPRTVDDREMELDAVLDEIQETPSYPKTLDVVSNQWDAASKQVIANSPQLLKVINSHVQTGIYDLITAEIEREKMFGRLNGLSDIEAYRQVGDSIQARGGFSHLSAQGHQDQPKQPVVVPPKPKMGDEGKRREKRLAAGSTKPAAPSRRSDEFNPLALSDDEFSKLIHNKFL